MSIQSTRLSKSNSYFDGEQKAFHNNTPIYDWKRNRKVDSINKMIIRLAEMWIMPHNKSKAPDERINIQNPALSKEIITHKGSKDSPTETLYKMTISTVQKNLQKLMKLGFIEKIVYLDKDKNKYDWNGGNREAWLNTNAGLTERHIVLNLAKVKEFMKYTNQSMAYKQAKGKSTLRRMIMRRPFTLLDKEITKQQVEDIRNAKANMNLYLLQQKNKFGDFTTFNNSNLQADAINSILSDIYFLIYDDDIPESLRVAKATKNN